MKYYAVILTNADVAKSRSPIVLRQLHETPEQALQSARKSVKPEFVARVGYVSSKKNSEICWVK